MTVNATIYVFLQGEGGEAKSQLDRIEELVRGVKTDTEKILMTEEEVLQIVKDVDTATTAIGGNVDSLAQVEAANGTLIQTIGDEVDALVARNPGIPATVSDALVSLRTRVNQAKDASDAVKAGLDAQVPVLQAIASKGAGNVVPIPVPPPPVIQLP